MSKEDSTNEELYQKPPSILKMIANFAISMAEFIAKGAPIVNMRDYKQRVRACGNCPHLKTKRMQCGLCGCFVEHKAKMKTAQCPDTPQRWAPQTPEYRPNE